MYYSSVQIVLALVTLVPKGSCDESSSCVPSEKGFHYSLTCPQYQYTKLRIWKITATQGDPPASVDTHGGFDLTIPLRLTFNFTYNGNAVKKHKMDLKLYQFMPGNDGTCIWDEIGADGLFDDLDMCQLITNGDCTYATHPDYIISIINFKDMFGEGVSGMKVGRYYKFVIVERDDKEPLSCFELQGKVIQNE